MRDGMSFVGRVAYVTKNVWEAAYAMPPLKSKSSLLKSKSSRSTMDWETRIALERCDHCLGWILSPRLGEARGGLVTFILSSEHHAVQRITCDPRCKWWRTSAMCSFLIYLDCGIDLPHEGISADVTDRPAHDTQGQAEQCHVPEVKCRLEETVHSVRIKASDCTRLLEL